MALNNQALPSYSFLMFLAFAAFGSYLWSSDPLNTARPPTQNAKPVSVNRLDAVPARLWQDPFRVIYARGEDEGQAPEIREIRNSRLPGTIRRYLDSTEGELRILGVMVSTEAIADAEERRRRRRYALINALAESGYVPEDAAHIRVTALRGWDEGAGGKSGEVIMPYEWFRQDPLRSKDGKSRKKVLLLWLDAAHYHAAPYAHLEQLVEALAQDIRQQMRMRYVILGPAGSGGLTALVNQIGTTDICSLSVAGMHILSPFATISNNLLYHRDEKQKRLEERFSRDGYKKGNCSLTFERTLYDDEQLMLRLVLELKNRGVTPGKNHVVLLSERDTTFGRALPASFRRFYCGNECNDTVHVYSYLRGIDGVAPGSDSGSGKRGQNADEARKRDASARNADVRRPTGSGQFDYLRRLADEIVMLDKKIIKEDGKGILAIGVLGSDVYDKLLILRALRSRLMGVTFFTTDLDAQFLHPAEFPWARNLVVASTFDLELHHRWQGSTPPFRDSYQTSAFYATRLAMQIPESCEVEGKDADRIPGYWQRKPLLFEIGRNGSVPLQPEESRYDDYSADFSGGMNYRPDGNQASPLHPVSETRVQWWPLLVIVAIAALGLLAWRQLSARSNYSLRWLGAGLLTLSAILAIAVVCSADEEPFLMLAGVSVWPTEIINSLTLVLSLYFICVSLRSLQANYRELGEHYRLQGWAESLAGKKDGASLFDDEQDGKGNWKMVLALMLLLSATMVALLPSTIGYRNIPAMLGFWLLLLMFWFVIIKRVLPIANINKWDEELSRQHDAPIWRYWKRYREYGSLRNRFLRAFTVVLIFQAFVSFVFTLFGLEPPPLRGEITRLVDSVVTVGSVLGMLFLLFYMVDATRLCLVWIRGLVENTYDWRGTAVEQISREMNISWPCAVHWIKLQIVARRTAEVNKLIYYPFIVIILILFSRINYFDDWGFPQGLAIITLLLIGIALYSAIKLRRIAEKVRGDFIDYLNREKIIVTGHKPAPNKPSPAQIDELLDSVRRLRDGAFQPILEQPLVKATLLLIGGMGFSASQFSALM